VYLSEEQSCQKFHPYPISKLGALGFFEEVARTNNSKKNSKKIDKTSDVGSFAAPNRERERDSLAW